MYTKLLYTLLAVVVKKFLVVVTHYSTTYKMPQMASIAHLRSKPHHRRRGGGWCAAAAGIPPRPVLQAPAGLVAYVLDTNSCVCVYSDNVKHAAHTTGTHTSAQQWWHWLLVVSHMHCFDVPLLPMMLVYAAATHSWIAWYVVAR